MFVCFAKVPGMSEEAGSQSFFDYDISCSMQSLKPKTSLLTLSLRLLKILEIRLLILLNVIQKVSVETEKAPDLGFSFLGGIWGLTLGASPHVGLNPGLPLPN